MAVDGRVPSNSFCRVFGEVARYAAFLEPEEMFAVALMFSPSVSKTVFSSQV